MRVSVLQLDTRFPRIPGDVGCVETYIHAPDIIRVPKASVAQVVTAQPESIDPEPFVQAAQQAVGDVVVTSCGFLAPFQEEIAAVLDRPFLASSLMALPEVCRDGRKVWVMTFDKAALGPAHLGEAALGGVIGLPEGCHLRQVIAGDRTELDVDLAQEELVGLVSEHLPKSCDVLVLECTNLPPYKAAIRSVWGGEVVDLLTLIEGTCPKTIRPQFL